MIMFSSRQLMWLFSQRKIIVLGLVRHLELWHFRFLEQNQIVFGSWVMMVGNIVTETSGMHMVVVVIHHPNGSRLVVKQEHRTIFQSCSDGNIILRQIV